jgi:hypothetical protein
MLHDDYSFSMATSTCTDTVEMMQQKATDPVHINDDFDDVFGSAPASPVFPDDNNNYGDALEPRGPSRSNTELSDVPRLKEKHETEGYRDGVTEGKADSVQKGFDEGYSLGATLGLRIGKILGLLEGICQAVQTATIANQDKSEWEAQGERMDKLYVDAKRELKTQNVFGKEWWGADGIWKFEVPGEGKEGREILFPDVAAVHPLVVKWEKIIQQEVDIWGLDLGLMEHEEDGKDIVERAELTEEPSAGVGKELAW